MHKGRDSTMRHLQETKHAVQMSFMCIHRAVGVFMGSVAISFNIMPTDPSTISSVKAELERLNPKQITEKPIGFGLKLIEAMFIIPDKEGNDLEEKIRKLPGVASVETAGITLV